jgi:IS5 family transposase
MEAQLYAALYKLVYSLAHPRPKQTRFNDRIVVMVYLWSVLWDRPVCWACNARNWSIELPFDLPSDSTMSRRLRTVGVQQLLERALSAASALFGEPPLVKQMDSKPMYVGPYSKDKDAKRGRVAQGLFARGYRLHTLNHGRIVRHFTLAPMNDHDSLVAPKLIEKLEGGGYAAADNAYDTNDLHQKAAAANHQLVSPPRAANKGVRDLKYNCPQRLRSLDLLDSPLQKCGLSGDFGRELYNCRQKVESGYGGMTFLGLNYLPAWVRGARRVACWSAGKILVYLCRTGINKGVMT